MLEETDGLAHGRFKVEGFDVLPVLLEEGDEEVDTYRRSGVKLKRVIKSNIEDSH